MANIKSQQKRILTNERAQAAQQVGEVVASHGGPRIPGGRRGRRQGQGCRVAGQSTSRKLDQAASKGVIHKNQAANRKSGLAAALNSL